ncbi:MAG: hypothetical protein HPM95_21350 [Alphaproteobacteria bacterium]|nr:hypothetical protein [Alphaproteobacteria bacterium]MBL6432515.1 hypothetical protein [Alphaproteobacteria bacterium]
MKRLLTWSRRTRTPFARSRRWTWPRRRAEWRHGGLTAADPATLFDAVASGALWVNIGHVGARDPRTRRC